MTHRHNAKTDTWKYRVLPGMVRYTFILFGLFSKPNLCPLTQNSGDATDFGHVMRTKDASKQVDNNYTCTLIIVSLVANVVCFAFVAQTGRIEAFLKRAYKYGLILP